MSQLAVMGGARAWTVWLLAVAFVIYLFGFQTGFAIVSPSVQKDLGLTVIEVGTVAATYTWVFAFCQFFSGSLLDRLGARRVLPACMALVAAGILVFANAASFPMLLASQAIVALGACAGFVGAGYVGGQWFGMAKFSLMFGLVQFAASLFSAFGQNFLAWALQHQSWRPLFNEIGMAGIGLTLLGILFIRDASPATMTAAATGQPRTNLAVELFSSLLQVGRIPHVWLSALFGAMCFGTMLSLGVVWGPKLMTVRGLGADAANWATSLLWLGLAAGCFAIPAISDALRRRKLPVIVGVVVQLAALGLILFMPAMDTVAAMALCFVFGFANAVHMLAFSTAADVVTPDRIGTSAAIVNGMMFLMGGILISRPGVRVSAWAEGHAGGVASLETAQFALAPMMVALVIALGCAAFMRETYPSR